MMVSYMNWLLQDIGRVCVCVPASQGIQTLVKQLCFTKAESGELPSRGCFFF